MTKRDAIGLIVGASAIASETQSKATEETATSFLIKCGGVFLIGFAFVTWRVGRNG